MIAVSRYALREALALLSSEEAISNGTLAGDSLTPENPLIRNTAILARRQGENLVRLSLEWMLDAASDDEIDGLLVSVEPEDFRPLIDPFYRAIWGDLPGGPSPRIKLFRVAGSIGDPAIRWAECRMRLYGEVENDLPRLRELAIRPDLVDGGGNPLPSIPCEGAVIL